MARRIKAVLSREDTGVKEDGSVGGTLEGATSVLHQRRLSVCPLGQDSGEMVCRLRPRVGQRSQAWKKERKLSKVHFYN
jgi:hypothetical protein